MERSSIIPTFYNNSLNNIHNNKSNYNADIITLNNKIKQLENTLYIEREEYKDFYRKIKENYIDISNIHKIKDYDNINNKLSEYILLTSHLKNENYILTKKLEILEKQLEENKISETLNDLDNSISNMEININKLQIDKLK